MLAPSVNGERHPSVVDLYEDDSLLPTAQPVPFSGIRLPDGRALCWAEYGSPRGLPCLLIPDAGSSRLAPRWLLHDSALPAAIRLLALDRPGVGVSDPIGFGGQEDPAEDLRSLVQTLAVGRIAVVGIGQGIDDAMRFAARYPTLVTAVLGVSARLSQPTRHRPLRPSTWSTSVAPEGPVAAWLGATDRGADLAVERTWQRALRRMDERSRRVLGERWHDSDFRDDLAADLALCSGSWTSPTRSDDTAWWQRRVDAPVHLWHGRDEAGTTAGELRTIADRTGWRVIVVNGCSAIFGAWPEILATATASFAARAG